MEDWVLPILLLIVWAVGTPILALVALVRALRGAEIAKRNHAREHTAETALRCFHADQQLVRARALVLRTLQIGRPHV